jgi:hypothetical protein
LSFNSSSLSISQSHCEQLYALERKWVTLPQITDSIADKVLCLM